MRHEQFYHGNNIAFEIDADFIDGAECTCALCRPHSSLVAFASRDGLTVDAPGVHAPHFNRQRLTHSFSHVADADTTQIRPFGNWNTAKSA